MSRTTIELDDEQAQRLRDFSAEAGRAPSDIVREALGEYLARRGAAPEARVAGPRRRLPDAEWDARFGAALERLRAGVDPTWTPEEIEADITAASEEARQERIARRDAEEASGA